jgi:alpha-amylase
MKATHIRRILTAIAAVALLLTGTAMSPAKAASLPFYAAPNKVVNESTVGIQMFMYPWTLIGSECTKVLGPSGIDWVQISPPQEHIRGEQWWVHYQPVSYKLESSLGNRAEFAAMVQACNKAGVMIIADTVINIVAPRISSIVWRSCCRILIPTLLHWRHLGVHNPLAARQSLHSCASCSCFCCFCDCPWGSSRS